MDQNPAEIDRLATDLMIGVTSFFRDPASWEALKRDVIHSLITDKKSTDSIRVWTPGCSTGEEAYSIVMMLLDEIETAQKGSDIQVFGTDINEASLAIARNAKYPGSVSADMPAEYLKAYFNYIETGSHVRIKKHVRDHVIFAKQNLLTDPPFSKLDLIICRNLLIYLEPEAQQKCLSIFHYALKENGCLFLGNAESIEHRKGFFKSLGVNRHRIFQRIPQTNPTRYGFSAPMVPESKKKVVASRPATGTDVSITKFAHETLLSLYAPAAVLVNNRYEILHFNGPVKRFLEPPADLSFFDFIAWIPEQMRNRVRGALYNASQTPEPVSIQVALQDAENKERAALFTIRSFKNPADNAEVFLITLTDNTLPQRVEGTVLLGTEADRAALRQLERELSTTRNDLQTNVEELKSSNEELQSSNEELEAANEEMETSREELQSINEELITVNAQLQSKIEEEEALNNDLNNFLSSTNIPTLFLDTQLNVRRFTPSITGLINLIPSDIGRPVADMGIERLGADLLGDIRTALDGLQTVKKEIAIADAWYLRSTFPFRTSDNRIEGVVITYVDITERKKAEDEIKSLAKFPAENPNPVIRLSLEGVVLYANDAAGPILKMWNATAGGAAPEETHATIAGAVAAQSQQTVEIEGNERIYSFDVVPVPESGYVNLYGRDITARKRAEEALNESRQRNAFLADILESSSQAFAVGYPDGRLGLLNKAFERLTGYNAEELQSIDWAAVLTPMEYREMEAHKLQELHKTGQPVRYEKEYLRKDGSRVSIELLVHLKKDAAGKPLYYYSFITDITERKKVELSLQESEERFRTIAETVPALISLSSIEDSTILFLNTAYCEAFGYRKEDIIGRKGSDVYYDPADRDKMLAIFRDQGFVDSYQIKARKSDGSAIWLLSSVKPVTYGGKPAIIGASIDITERKLAEEVLAFQAQLLSDVHDAVFSSDINYTITFWNQAAEKMFGWTKEEALGKNSGELLKPKVEGSSRDQERSKLRSAGYWEGEVQYVRKDGKFFLADINSTILKNAAGKDTGNVIVCRDITDRKRADQALRESEERFRALAENIPDLITRFDRELRLIYANPAVLQRTGLTGEAMQGRSAREYGAKPEAAALWEKTAWLVFDMGKPQRIEVTNDWQGELRVYDTILIPERDIGGTVRAVVSVARDITGRKLIEQALRESEEKYRSLFETMTEGFSLNEIILDDRGMPVDLRYLMVNPAFERQTGLKAADTVGKTVLELFPQAEPVWFELYGKVVLTGEPARFEGKFGPLERWFNVNAFPAGGNKFAVVFTDITDRKKMEASLLESEDRYRNLVKFAPAGIYEIDFTTGRFTEVNDVMCRLLGFTREELLAITPSDILDDEGKAAFKARIARAQSGDQPEDSIEYRVRTKDGRFIWGLLNVTFHWSGEKILRATVVAHDITERKRAEEALRESEDRARARAEEVQRIMEVAPIAIWVANDPQCYDIVGNREANRFYEAEEEENVSAGPASGVADRTRRFFHAGRELRPEELPMQEAATKGIDVRDSELEVLLPSGRKMTMIGHASPLRNAEGNIRGCVGAFLDITKRKNAEKALSESEQKYRALFNAMDEGFCIIEMLFDAEGKSSDYRFLEVNTAFERQTGLHDAKGKLMRDLAPAHEAHWFEIYGKIALTGESAHFINEAQALNRYFDVYAYRVGRPEDRHVAIIFNDVSEIKRAEKILQAQAALLNLAHDAIIVRNMENKITFWNHGAEVMYGWSGKEVMGHVMHDLLKTRFPRPLAEINREIEENGAWEDELAHICKDGREIIVDSRWVVQKDESGHQTGIMELNREITVRKLAERALHESEERLKFHLENSPLAVVEWNADYMVTQWSIAAERIFGWNKEEVLGKRIDTLNLIYTDDIPIVTRTMEKLSGGKEVTVVSGNRNFTKSGGVIECLWYNSVLLDENKRMKSVMSLVLDITERKKAEEALQKSYALLKERNVELDSFNYSVSHDLQGPLRIIGGFSKMLEREYAANLDDQGKLYLEHITKTGDRMAQIIKDLLKLSRITRAEMKRVDVDLSSMATTIAAELKQTAPERDVEFLIGDIVVHADPGLMHIVMENLISNAWKFSSKCPHARIEFSSRREGDKTIYFVRDNGDGFPMAQVQKLFSPFRRLHSDREFPGTGIGLAVVRRIIGRHGGKVWAEGEVGKGATIYFELPTESNSAIVEEFRQ